MQLRLPQDRLWGDIMNANEIKADFQLLASAITNIDLKNNFIGFNEYDENLKKEFDVSYKFGNVEYDDDQLCMGVIILDIDVSVYTTASDERLDLHLTIEGCFTAENIKADDFKSMLGVNGCTCLYSIARSTIISITSQTLVTGKIILPMINTFKLVEEQPTD